MSLRNCPACGHKISTSAKSCVSCGHPINDNSFITEIFKYAGTVLAVLVPLVSFTWWFADRIETQALEAVKPYNLISVGQSLAEFGSYEDAIKILRDAYKKFDQEKMSNEEKEALAGPYLSAISHAENPYEYRNDLTNITNLIGDSNIDPWYDLQYGFYFLFGPDSERNKAEKHFCDAIDSFRSNEMYIDCAEAHWGLTIFYLLNNDHTKAYEQLKLSNDNDPVIYSIDELIKETKKIKKTKWFRKLSRRYPDFEPIFSKFISDAKVKFDQETKYK